MRHLGPLTLWVFAALFAQAGLAPAPADSEIAAAWQRRLRERGVVVNPIRPTRRMRGDYEPIDVLVLVYHAPWDQALRTIVSSLAGEVDIQVLFPDMGRKARRFQREMEHPCLSARAMTVDTPWIRDYGPLQIFEDDSLHWLDYGYAEDRAADDAVPAQLAHDHGAQISYEEPALDGGAIISNGDGLCVMTMTSANEAQLMNGRERRQFAERVGCRGLAIIPALPEETTGHVDVVGQFLDARQLAFAEMAGEEGRLLNEGLSIIQQAAGALGQDLEVTRVPMLSSGEVFYSYVNGTRVRDVFLVPSYSAIDPEVELAAYQALGRAMPGIELLSIDADEMVPLGGALHCTTLGLSTPTGRQCEAEPLW